MPMNDLQFSNFTKTNKIRFTESDALRYLYFNGKMKPRGDRSIYSTRVQKTTICNHVRFLHLLTWFKEEVMVKYIYYCIADAKNVVGHLRNEKDGKTFDDEWYKLEKVSNPFSKDDDNDDFWTSAVKYKCKDIDRGKLEMAKELLEINRTSLPRIFLAYKTMLTMANTMELDEDEYLRNDIRITILECVYLRYRLDRKVAEYEEEKVKSVKRK